MLCLKHFLAFFLLLPFPAAPPVVTLLFAIVMFHRFRACAYCSVLVLLLFFATCKTHFLSLTLPERPPDVRPLNAFTWLPSVLDPAYPANTNSTAAVVAQEPFRYSAPVVSRCWCDLNGGRLLWPVLEGYKLIDVKEKAIWEKRKAEREAQKQLQASSSVPASSAARSSPLGPNDWPPIPPYEAGSKLPSGTTWMERFWPNFHARRLKETQAAAPPSPVDAAAPEPPQEPEHPTGPITTWEELGGGGGHGMLSDATPEPEAEAMPNTQPSSDPVPQATALSSSLTPESKEGRPRRIDLRLGGLGVVLDLGFSRSESAVRQEVEEWLEYLDERERGREKGRTWWEWWRELGRQQQQQQKGQVMTATTVSKPEL